MLPRGVAGRGGEDTAWSALGGPEISVVAVIVRREWHHFNSLPVDNCVSAVH